MKGDRTTMNKIEVMILKHNLDGTPIFLAKLTQRGHLIHNMTDLISLYLDSVNKVPSRQLLDLPHTTIQRMCEMTVAITGLSTKAVSQLRTHAKRLTFISTSTQYSEFTDVEDPYVIPEKLSKSEKRIYKTALNKIHKEYSKLYYLSKDKDSASYMLPQALRKCLIIHGNFAEWKYVLQTRLCNRNTREVQYICELIIKEMRKRCGDIWADLCLPKCAQPNGKCEEGKFSCGVKYEPVD